MFQRLYSDNGASLAEQAWLRALAYDDATQQADYRLYRQYFEGRHNVPLTDRQREYLEQHGVDFRFNFLRPRAADWPAPAS